MTEERIEIQKVRCKGIIWVIGSLYYMDVEVHNEYELVGVVASDRSETNSLRKTESLEELEDEVG